MRFQLLNQVATPICVVNAQQRNIVWINAEMEVLTGHSLEPLLQKPFQNLVSDKFASQLSAIFDVLSSSTGEVHLKEQELMLNRKSGRAIPVHLSVSTYTDLNEKFWIFSFLDLSELKASQAEREAAQQELTRVSQMADIGQLAAGVAHELNNPLAVIQGFAENIEALVEHERIEPSELSLQIIPIVKSAQRMARIIAGLNNMAQDHELHFSQCRLRDIVEDVLVYLGDQIRYFRAELTIDVSDRIKVRCDATQLEQVILNVVTNALQSFPNDQSDRKVSLTAKSEKNGETCLEIWNNGPEIPVDVQDRLFKPFFTTKEVGEGTGLGLYISYSIMKGHGGRLQFVSAPRRGTTFQLILPIPKVLEKAGGEGKTVLVVDDEPFFRHMFARKLERFGFKVVVARDGEKALEAFGGDSSICAVFTDLRMPRMDGIQLVNALRKKSHDLLVFVVSAFADISSTHLQVQRLGINGILKKPLDASELNHAVRQVQRQVSKTTKSGKRTRKSS